MNRNVLMAALAASLSYCAPAPRAAAPPEPNPTIEVRGYYFGQIVSRWSISSTGDGFFRKDPGGPPSAPPAETRAVAAGPAGYRQIEAILRPLHARIGMEVHCRQVLLDVPSSEISWREGERVEKFGISFGCVAPETDEAGARLSQATRLMAAWAQHGPAVPEASEL